MLTFGTMRDGDKGTLADPLRRMAGGIEKRASTGQSDRSGLSVCGRAHLGNFRKRRACVFRLLNLPGEFVALDLVSASRDHRLQY